MACVAGKEFALEAVIRMENAGIPVYSTPEQCGRCIGHYVSASEKDRESLNAIQGLRPEYLAGKTVAGKSSGHPEVGAQLRTSSK